MYNNYRNLSASPDVRALKIQLCIAVLSFYYFSLVELIA